MKRFLLVILCFIAAIQLHAQVVQWGPVVKVEEAFSKSNQAAHAKYLGQINGSEYYTYYSKRPKGFVIEDTRFAFLEVNGTNITKFSPYSDGKYDYLDVCIANNQICVAYETEVKKTKREIKIDYYSPGTFKKTKTNTLFTFDLFGKDDPYINMFHSENNQFNGLFATIKNPETGRSTIVLKCFNENFEEVWTNYFDYNGNGYVEIGDMFITNSGNIVVHFLKYESEKKKSLQSFYFAQISGENSSTAEYEINGKIDLIDYKLGEYYNGQKLFVYTKETEIFGIKLDFTNQLASHVFAQKTYEGNWKIDKLIDLGNGRFTAALQNRDMVTIVNRNSNGAVTSTFYYWNRSFQFIGINGDNDEIIYSKNLGRKYAYMQGLPTYEHEIEYSGQCDPSNPEQTDPTKMD